jgi:hypothetical protein
MSMARRRAKGWVDLHSLVQALPPVPVQAMEANRGVEECRPGSAARGKSGTACPICTAGPIEDEIDA